MFAFLILPILVAGFIYCHNHPYHKYRLHRHDGQYLYINSARFGVYFFIAANIIAAIISGAIPDQISAYRLTIPLNPFHIAINFIESRFLLNDVDAPLAAWLFNTSIFALIIAFITARIKWYVKCLKIGNEKDARLYIISELLKDSPLDSLLFELSIKKDALVMLTLSDRKVYVGKVISLGEPNESEGLDQEITISPVVSGYRNKDTLRVTFSTYYQDSETDLAHVIRQDMITHATEFSFDIFEAFEKENPDSTPESKSAIEIAAILEQESASKLK